MGMKFFLDSLVSFLKIMKIMRERKVFFYDEKWNYNGLVYSAPFVVSIMFVLLILTDVGRAD